MELEHIVMKQSLSTYIWYFMWNINKFKIATLSVTSSDPTITVFTFGYAGKSTSSLSSVFHQAHIFFQNPYTSLHRKKKWPISSVWWQYVHTVGFLIFTKINLLVNTLRPRQNGRHFADDIFKCIFLNENVWIPLKISLKFVPKGPINNIPAVVQIMAWRRPGDKPLSEPVMVSLLTHICVTRPQWVNFYIWKKIRIQDSVYGPLKNVWEIWKWYLKSMRYNKY